MKKTEKSVLMLLFILTLSSSGGPEEMPSFWFLSGNGSEESKLETGKDPVSPGGHVLKITYRFPQENKGNKALFLNLKQPLIIQTEEEKLSLQVYSDASGHRLYIECVDRDGESLLFSYRDPQHFRTLDRNGWQKFQLHPLWDKADTWGGKTPNRKADFPLRVIRLWLDPVNPARRTGTLYLKELRKGKDASVGEAFDPATAKVEVSGENVKFKRKNDTHGTVFELNISGRDFPGIVLTPRNRFWNLSEYRMIRADVENLSRTEQVEFHMRIHSANPSGNRKERTVYTTTALNPEEKKTVELLLPHVERRSAICFSSTLQGAPEGVDKAPNLFADKIVRLTLYTQYPHKTTLEGIVRLRISNIRPAAPYRKQRAPLENPDLFFPFVDEFGQYIHSDWKEKIHSATEMTARFDKESSELKSGKRINSWNRYGGWANGPKRKTNGFFRTEKYRGKWWLIDPDGCLFLSNGINAIQFFDDFKVRDPRWYRTRTGKGQILDFVRSNLLKKYRGKLFPDVFSRTHKRLELWGLNTIGGWSDPSLCQQRKTPYTLVLFDWGKAPKLGKLYDPFHPEFAEALNRFMKSDKCRWSLNDPFCIGYFVNNELPFGTRSGYAEEAVLSPPGTPAKQKLEHFLAVRYRTIKALNHSWNTAFVSWEDFQKQRMIPKTKNAKQDLEEFSDRLTEEYFKVCRRIVKKNAPHQLYLGCRFNGRCHPDKPWLFRIAARHCDVVSFNCYSNSVAQYMRNDLPDIPILIGEFALNVRDRGMFNDNLRSAGTSQKDRAEGYLRYWQGLLMHPNLVGAHWFTWVDQPLTGRFDGENYQFGVVDCTDTPYPELTSAMRQTGKNMYEYRLTGNLQQPLN